MSKDDAAYNLLKVDENIIIKFLNWKVSKYKTLVKEQRAIINERERIIKQLKNGLIKIKRQNKHNERSL